MCDALLQNYASRINADDQDMVPSILVFSGTDCTGAMWPTMNGDFPVDAQSFPTASTITPPITFQSIVVPFNFTHIQLLNAAGSSLDVFGPMAIADTSMLDVSQVTKVRVVELVDWVSTVIPSACTGSMKYIGSSALTRYAPQSQRCDAVMTLLCSSNPATNPLCGCFADLADLESRGLNLPVACFGQRCVNAYKTANMVSEPCNITLCQQQIQATPNVPIDVNFTIYCGGNYFRQNGDLVPSANATAADNTKAAEESPLSKWIAYIVLGVGMFLSLLLVFLIFSPSSKRKTDELDQIQKLVTATRK